MSIKSEAVKRWRKNAKSRLIESFGGSCCVCGYNKCDNALEFHHLNPNEKEISWSSMRGSIRSWDTIVDEMQKCIMVCSNCHKEIHAGITCVPEDAPRMNPDIRFYREQRMIDSCPRCGASKPKYAKTCGKIECKTVWRKVNWSEVDVISLVKEQGSYAKAGDILGVDGATVARRYKKVIQNQ